MNNFVEKATYFVGKYFGERLNTPHRKLVNIIHFTLTKKFSMPKLFQQNDLPKTVSQDLPRFQISP